ncbi:MAG: PilN domain-containing protein [Sedimentisphaerales bacterium]|nr:PilN domain-containing protein [Sedimentisphaerales bacterium]
MVAVDLIPNEMKVNQHRNQRIRVWTMICLAATFVVGSWSAIKYLKLYQLRDNFQQTSKQFDGIQQDINQLQQKIAQLDSFRDRLAVLSEMRHYGDFARLTSFLADNSPELLYLDEMLIAPLDDNKTTGNNSATNVPKSTGLFKLKDAPSTSVASPTSSASPVSSASSATAASEPSADTRQLYKTLGMTLKGRALDHSIVGRYLITLRQSELFHSVTLKHALRLNSNVDPEKSGVQFEIECKLTPQAFISLANKNNHANL